MKKLLGVIGSLSLVSSISGNITSCSTDEDSKFIFTLKSEIGEALGSFDKRNLKDYYFEIPPHWDDEVNNIVVILKDDWQKTFNVRSQPTVYWLNFMVKGLKLKPAQEKYNQKVIADWVWKSAGLWDWEHNKPEN